MEAVRIAATVVGAVALVVIAIDVGAFMDWLKKREIERERRD
jgi:hypothetical protein